MLDDPTKHCIINLSYYGVRSPNIYLFNYNKLKKLLKCL